MKITLLSAQFRLSTANCLATVNRCSCFILLILLVLSCKEKESLPGNGHILSFALQTVTATSINIDESTGRIQIAVAYGTVLNALSADIQISPSATIVPSGSVLQDFSRPVSYTVTAANGSKKVYTVMVSSAQQPAAQILGFSKESLRAGETLLISGKDFGSFGLAINAMLKNVQGQEFAIPSELIDSSHVRLTIPVSIDPAAYFVKIIKNKLETVSTQTIMVRIPAPEITAVKVHNILQGDSLVVAGSYIVPALHVYQLILVGEQGTYSLPSAAAQNGKLSFAVGTDIKAGLYTASLLQYVRVSHW
ncbi:DUF5018 domain-containing protein [Dyadobacter sp. NIV53]|uniref:DUF5018 domain-containing protein n=1 Tax=Dyadobacter sp. NIV53 TaxID=2861765 RepID=UPI001C884DD1|nr:DUF5018 domain-containing protein [Dyadobacter sp. NIV53]